MQIKSSQRFKLRFKSQLWLGFARHWWCSVWMRLNCRWWMCCVQNSELGAEEAFKILHRAFEMIGEPVSTACEHVWHVRLVELIVVGLLWCVCFVVMWRRVTWRLVELIVVGLLWCVCFVVMWRRVTWRLVELIVVGLLWCVCFVVMWRRVTWRLVELIVVGLLWCVCFVDNHSSSVSLHHSLYNGYCKTLNFRVHLIFANRVKLRN